MNLELISRLVIDRPAASGMPFLSAASGLVLFRERAYVVGDDETRLAIFQGKTNRIGRTVRLFEDRLPRDAKARKAAKADLETLLLIPPGKTAPHGALLALGSGSTERRRRAALAELRENGDIAHIRHIDLSRLFEAIASIVEEVNIEGAVLRDDVLLLFNRGNRTHPATAVLAVDMAAVTSGAAPRVGLQRQLVLPSIDGVPLSVTDACALDQQTLLMSAVAEDTGDAYADGKLVGAALVLLDAELETIHVEPIVPAIKIEGVHAWRDGKVLRLLAVSDADDPQIAAGFYAGALTLA